MCSYYFSSKNTLQKLIHTYQTGFIAGRYMGENTRLVYDVMHFTEENNIPGLLLLIDFEKAFDSVSWSFLYKVLDFFGFGNSMISWIQLFNNNARLSVNLGGHLSPFLILIVDVAKGTPCHLFCLFSVWRS